MIKRELYLIDNLVFTETRKHLDDLQKKIILMLLDGKKYSEIAQKHGYDEGYIGDKSRQFTPKGSEFSKLLLAAQKGMKDATRQHLQWFESVVNLLEKA